MVRMQEVLSMMNRWITEDRTRVRWIAVADASAVFHAHQEKEFKEFLAQSDVIVPGGVSLLLAGRFHGYHLPDRVTGIDLMKAFFEASAWSGVRHYFVGDTTPTLGFITARLRKRFPGLIVAGSHSPPFRQLTPEEDGDMIARINAARPDVLWVGLGSPRQERWISEHRDKLQVPLVLSVGTAFKYFAGTLKRAPTWMTKAGLEWSWTFFQQPRRMWRRVLINGPQFVGRVGLELSKLRRYD
jgi:N-acetylglucosaminyldiphosphoundecaprenol N-acetyl-beta-D-mannosaminyltransferase